MKWIKSMFAVSAVFLLVYCSSADNSPQHPWEKHGPLMVKSGSPIIEHQDGTPFLWLGCTAWGMTEWLPREDVDLYLDDRQSKGMNVVQLCLFWGKRVDYPTKSTANPENPYGHKALKETDGLPDPRQSALVEGGLPTDPPGAPFQSPSPHVAAWPERYFAATCTFTKSN